MGDSGLTVYLGIAAWAVIVLALVMTVVACRTHKRPVRVGIGLGLMVLGLLCGGLSLVPFGLVTGLGVAVLILGIRIRRADSQDGGIGQ
jgi:cadmium resistance protein CadD (predicted permease)